jgi:bifunctional DNA-binding transcriptional regulator/antitoxin component of YhaV-PrlF toxin-antitoxin module
MFKSTVNEQGQTTVPASVRKALKAPPGTVLAWSINGASAEVIPLAAPNRRKRRSYDYLAHLERLRNSPTVSEDLLRIQRSKSL